MKVVISMPLATCLKGGSPKHFPRLGNRRGIEFRICFARARNILQATIGTSITLSTPKDVVLDRETRDISASKRSRALPDGEALLTRHY